MHARTGTLQVSPDRIDDVVRKLESEQLGDEARTQAAATGEADQPVVDRFEVLLDDMV